MPLQLFNNDGEAPAQEMLDHFRCIVAELNLLLKQSFKIRDDSKSSACLN